MQEPKKIVYKTRGAMIMEIAELFRPILLEKLATQKDAHGIPLHPSKIKALALNMAHDLVRAESARPGQRAGGWQ